LFDEKHHGFTILGIKLMKYRLSVSPRRTQPRETRVCSAVRARGKYAAKSALKASFFIPGLTRL